MALQLSLSIISLNYMYNYVPDSSLEVVELPLKLLVAL